jgi:hypothetical protein
LRERGVIWANRLLPDFARAAACPKDKFLK